MWPHRRADHCAGRRPVQSGGRIVALAGSDGWLPVAMDVIVSAERCSPSGPLIRQSAPGATRDGSEATLADDPGNVERRPRKPVGRRPESIAAVYQGPAPPPPQLKSPSSSSVAGPSWKSLTSKKQSSAPGSCLSACLSFVAKPISPFAPPTRAPKQLGSIGCRQSTQSLCQRIGCEIESGRSTG